MKWETNTQRVPEDQHWSRCGYLYVRIEQIAGYNMPSHPDYEPPKCEWFVEPDDEDKSYRRALATGYASTIDAAKAAVAAACEQLVAEMLASLREVYPAPASPLSSRDADARMKKLDEGEQDHNRNKPPGSSWGIYCNETGCVETLSLIRTTATAPTHEDDYQNLGPALDTAAMFLGWRLHRSVWWRCPTHAVDETIIDVVEQKT